MLLRASSSTSEIDLNAALNSATANGIPHSATLIAFAEAVLGTDDPTLNTARNTLLEELGPQALVDSAAIVATFMHMDRIADATGIPLDHTLTDSTSDLRGELGLNDFGSAQNTLGRTAV